ncbi:hypothetical protein BaRGS_00003988 [Batillaria attramentaria]|uniref:Uncharacterized protein n=1 Tax=Batillaria attramentaria TaxID=370345 RepID=A0ABD0M0B9_9CAEN
MKNGEKCCELSDAPRRLAPLLLRSYRRERANEFWTAPQPRYRASRPRLQEHSVGGRPSLVLDKILIIDSCPV